MTGRLIITRGLPGSGKTHWAQNFCAEIPGARVRVNRDDLRSILNGGEHGYSAETEGAVTLAQEASVRALLKAGKIVVVDDMNLRQGYARRWKSIADQCGVEFDVVDLTNVSVEECIKRDQTRYMLGGRRVGAEFIKAQHERFLKGKTYPLPSPENKPSDSDIDYVPYVVPPGAPKCILVDLDGTMALNTGGRNWYDWARVGEDTPNPAIVNLVKMIDEFSVLLYQAGDGDEQVEIIFMSGRDEISYLKTWQWLDALDLGDKKLFMRPSLPAGVQQPKDSTVKLALFDEHIRHQYDVQFVLDDRDSVVEMWRALGLTCLQVAPGAF